MAEDRLPIMHRMIVADSERERKAALDTLHGMQMTDFEGIFSNMRGLPVIIRLLDPPLHEFLPKEADLKEQLVELENNGKGITIEADGLRKMLIKVESLRESNPMMGFPRMPSRDCVSRDLFHAGACDLRCLDARSQGRFRPASGDHDSAGRID